MRGRAWLWLLLAAGGVLLATKGAGVIARAAAKLRELIEREEGLRLEVYRDSAGYWTVGYGHKIVAGDPYFPNTTRRTITQAEAEQLLERDTAAARAAVEQATGSLQLNANQLAALQSLAFNIGARAFSTSTLVKKLQAGDLAGVQAEFGRWIYAGGAPVLVGRRAREAALFGAPDLPTTTSA